MDEVKGRIFSIEEFAVFDGPGIRTTVFFKGCPLRCNWCHNPEGLCADIRLARNPNGCMNCERCDGLLCPRGLVRVSGVDYTAAGLTAVLEKNFEFLNSSGGGITFSGGECLTQPVFLTEMLKRLKGRTHLAVQTSGFGDGKAFKEIVKLADLVLFDMKLADEESAKKYTGQGFAKILKNFLALQQSATPYIVRVPLIPGVTDTEANIISIAELCADGRRRPESVELLPYNIFAGSKYKLAGLEYKPLFDENAAPNTDTKPFVERGIKCTIA